MPSVNPSAHRSERVLQPFRRSCLALGVSMALGACASTGRSSAGSVSNADADRRSAGTGLADAALPVTDESLALHVLNRLGWGPRDGDLDRMMRTGFQSWVEAQLDPDRIAEPVELSSALSRFTTLDQPHAPTLALFASRQNSALSAALTEADREQARRQVGELVQQVQSEARQARLLRAVLGARQLESVLVDFWFNHFNVFGGKESVRATASFYEAEAIRPHVLGRFRDMLGATARHPAMLNYLDNWQSVAPRYGQPMAANVPGGFQPPRGLNENYARELLELHTLGVKGGYTQADVTELARVFTGWSFDRRNPGPRDAFRFYPERHDPFPKTFLGQRVPGIGQSEGEWALDVLARHPSTARHLARKLAIAFVADDPPQSLVDRLATRFTQTDGDLKQVMRALAFSPEFLDPAVRGAKFKTPQHQVISAARACNLVRPDARLLNGAIARMGMPVYLCPTPDGWQDTRQTWLNPEALRQRTEFADALAGALRRQSGDRAARPLPAAAPALGSFGTRTESLGLPQPLLASLAPSTRRVISTLPESDRMAVALASPDFMRR